MDLIAIATQYLEAELSVFPTRENKKTTQPKWEHLQDAPMSVEEASDCFSGQNVYGVALVCGKVSGGVECIDFDAHGGQDIKSVFQEWVKDEGVKDIIVRNKLFVEKSPHGYHVIYRYDSDGEKYKGGTKLAHWPDGETMIETRAEGQYIIVTPTPGYKPLKNDLLNLYPIRPEERDYLLDKAKSLNQYVDKNAKTGQQEGEVKGFDGDDPVSWFNWNKAGYAKELLKEEGWVKIDFNEKDGIEQWRRPGKTEGTSATWGRKHNALYVFSTSALPFKNDCYYTPFQILTKLRFDGEYRGALQWIVSKYFNEDIPYIRVGINYFKKIIKKDRYGVGRVELKSWTKDEIKQDHGAAYMRKIPLYDDFTIVPDNISYQPVVENCYNLYKEFSHQPAEGDCTWSLRMMEHIFGEQLPLGLRYVQALYLHPDHMLPILVLISRARQTGKTTFLNWMNMLFGDNMVYITPEDLMGSFNAMYATSNIIGIEETLIERAIGIEKLKALSTGKFVSVNLKWVQQFKVPFYGKIILASNREEDWGKIDQEEIRFFIRKPGVPKHYNHNIENDLVREIPAFLHYLTTLPPIDWKRDRSGFTPEELYNENLSVVKQESRSWLYKELTEYITDWFSNNPTFEVLRIGALDIKQKWYINNSRLDLGYIRKVIKTEFQIQPAEMMRYFSFDAELNGGGSRVGKPYEFKRQDFISDIEMQSTQIKEEKKVDLPF